MHKSINFRLLAFSFLLLMFSCQRELTPEMQTPSAGSLQRDMNGNCQPITVAGTYNNRQNLSDTNYLEVAVNVTNPGTYNIQTDIINGYSFKATGSFSGTGAARIRLIGSGNPVIPGTDSFLVTYGSSVCQAPVTVGTNVIGPAVFTLAGASGSCMNDTIYGSYVKGIALDTSAKIKVSLNVTAPGTYTISTNNVNGYSFSASAAFSAIGVQNVFLEATGTPLNAGTDVFTVEAGASVCSFSLIVLTAVTVTNNDYFPLTDNSYWTYDDVKNPGDSVKRTVVDTATIDNDFYKVVKEDVKFGAPNQYLFRKSGNNYFEYGARDKYTGSFAFARVVSVSLPFLKQSLTTGNTWESEEYTDAASFGQVLTLKYEYACVDAIATVTINGIAFANVYKIVVRPYLRSIDNPYGSTSEVYLLYFAKGIGLIYFKKTSNTFVQSELQIRKWQVN